MSLWHFAKALLFQGEQSDGYDQSHAALRHREVTRDELVTLPCPPPTKTWAPVGHARVLDTAISTLGDAGYTIEKARLGVSRDGGRFFGTLDLSTQLTPDGSVTLAVGIRNSVDKTFPMGFCAGSRVFVCDNLAFRSDLMVRRKHSLNGVARFSSDIAGAVMQLTSFKDAETGRIAVMHETEMTDVAADSFILRAVVEKGIMPLRAIPAVVREWKEPRHELFQPRTAWSLFNAFTAAFATLQESNPAELARRTMRLSTMLTPAVRAAVPDPNEVLAV